MIKTFRYEIIHAINKIFWGNIFRSLVVGSQEDLTVVTSPMHSTTQILLNNRNNCVKSPIQLNQNSSEKFVKLCDNNKKQQNNLNNSVNLPPPPASPRSPRRSTSAALDYQNAVRYLNCQKSLTLQNHCSTMADFFYETLQKRTSSVAFL